VRDALRPGLPVGGHPAEYDRAVASPAAVLVALFEEAGEAHVVLTRRAATMRSHRHQVAFPGGRLDPGERAEEAAVREAYEEVGIEPETVEILGALPPLATFSGLSAITPLVGALPGRPKLLPNPDEVERAFSVPLAELVADRCHWEERWPFPDGGLRPVHFFDLPEDLVWGATARILVTFLCQLLVLPNPQAWP
jgi:8-oxo-dGTP pyrophosphatase MutT (NUDIX family)